MQPTLATTPLSKAVQDINASRWMTPANVLVVYRDGDATGLAAAQYYQAARGIPDANMVKITGLSWTPNSNSMSTTDCNLVIAQLAPYYKAPIQCVVTMHWWPKLVGGRHFSNILAHLLKFNSIAAGTRYNADQVAGATEPEGTMAGQFYTDYNVAFKNMNLAAGKQCGVGQYVTPAKHRPRQVPPHDYLTLYPLAPIPHFRLEVAPVDTTDTRVSPATELTYLKRIIDNSIAAEAARYIDFGTVLLSGSSSGNALATYGIDASLATAYPVYRDLEGIPCTKYYDQMTVEVSDLPRNYNTGLFFSRSGAVVRTITGNHLMEIVTDGTTHATVEPTWGTPTMGQLFTDGTVGLKYVGTIPATAVYPAGADSLSPGKTGKTFVNQTNVFFRAVGMDSYHDVAKDVETTAHFTYRTGAIVMFSQSYSARPNPLEGMDYEFGTPVCIAMAAKDCYNVKAAIEYTNANGLTVQGTRFTCTKGGLTTATVSVTTPGTVLLKENGATVATLVIASGTPRAQFTALTAAIAADPALVGVWSCLLTDNVSPGGMFISRSDVAVRNGAVAYFGSATEPYSSGAVRATLLTKNLWYGMSLGECAYTQLDLIDHQLYTYCVGDPLYRPFGHRR